MDNEELIKESYLKERRAIGITGILLPLLCWLSCLPTPDKPEEWCESLSATYHLSPVLPMVLSIVSCFLFTYEGYDLRDRIVNKTSAIAALTVALFPCSVDWVGDNVGIFNLPKDVSNIIHCTAAILLFTSFMVNICFNFTLGHSDNNKWYYIISGAMVVLPVPIILLGGDMKVFWCETVELLLFGTAWLIKGRWLSKNS